MDGGFDITRLIRKTAPQPAPAFSGYPEHNFIGGHNDPAHIPVEDLIAAFSAVMRRDGRGIAMYTAGQGPLGYLPLRQFVADKLKRWRGIGCSADEVLILPGSNPGIDLLCQVLLDPGETVIVEEYSYAGALGRIRKSGAAIVPAPLDDDGIRIDALERILDDLKAKGTVPKFIYTIPTIQNPTGSIMPLGRRQQLVALAKARGIAILEDECYADLTWNIDAPPALYSLDPAISAHIGSFSKTLAPALRVGYVVAKYSLLGRLVASRTEQTGALEQMVVAEYFSSHFEQHVRSLTGVLKDKLDTMVEAVAREFGTAVEPYRPKGGIFLWLKFPDSIDVRTLIKPAADAGIAFNPGPEWACDPSGAALHHMRLCFALPSKDQIREGVAALARVCHEQTGIPVYSANKEIRA